jgi:hypothetical protein
MPENITLQLTDGEARLLLDLLILDLNLHTSKPMYATTLYMQLSEAEKKLVMHNRKTSICETVIEKLAKQINSL